MAEKKFGSTMQTLDRLKKSGDLAALTRKNKPAQAGQRDISIDDILPDPDQPRRHFDKDQLASLAESIRTQGVLQAITVQPADAAGKHMLIMGERRFQAAKLAGLTRIPAVVREMTDALRMAQLTENVQRADLTTLEVAEAPMKPLILSAAMMAALAESGAAQEICIEPIRPESAYLLSAGFSGAELRTEFRRYFSEVEGYLNCLNETSDRIRDDARAAAYDYQRVLETTDPGEADQGDDEFQLPSVAMNDTGELFLDYRPDARDP